jgi:type IV pilus assembly protein PilN
MIKINLLPYREKAKKENLTRQATVIAGSFIIFILCLAWIYIYMSSQVAETEAKLATSKQSLKILDEKVGDLEKYKLIKAELQLKLDVIGKLEENRLLPVKTLDDLSMLVPQKSIWLTKIDQTNDVLKIEGIGRDNIAAADFMKTIEGFAPIQSVDLVSSKKVDIAGITLQQFIFSCKMKKGF